MELPPDAKLFAQKIAWQNQRIILIPAPRLQESIELRWRSIVTNHAEIVDEHILLQILVRDLCDRLSATTPPSIELDFWRSFLAGLALRVADRIFKIVSTHPEDLAEIQSICLAAIVHPDRFLQRFDRQLSGKPDLLSSLKAYAYKIIQYSAYPEIRKTFNDPNIGRSIRSLFNRYSNGIIRDALANAGVERVQIDRDLHLCQCAREYLRQTGQRIDRLVATDFDRIGEIYREITGDLPPPVVARLELVGSAISKFISPRLVSTNTQLGGDMTTVNYTIENTLASDRPPPDEQLAMAERDRQWQQIFQLSDQWSISQTDSYERHILLLRYGFDLNQTPIGNILNKDQTTICRTLRQLHRRMAEELTRSLNPESDKPSNEAIELTIELLAENFQRLAIYRQIDRQIIADLSRSIAALKLWLQQKEHRGRKILPPELIEPIRQRLDRIVHK